MLRPGASAARVCGVPDRSRSLTRSTANVSAPRLSVDAIRWNARVSSIGVSSIGVSSIGVSSIGFVATSEERARAQTPKPFIVLPMIARCHGQRILSPYVCDPEEREVRSRSAAALFSRLPLPVRLAVLHGLHRYAPWEEEFDFTPPPVNLGERTGPPDFVGIGVQKAGTSWWYSLIVAHPGVSDRPDIHKERHFLSRFGSEPFAETDIDRYHGWFPRVPGTLAGEWTPDYLWFPWVPVLLQRAAPEARLLVVLRDPVERFRSGVAHQFRNGAKRTGATVAEAVERGFYGRQLSSWKSFSDSGQLMVLQYEKCVREPEEQIVRTYRHLGLDDGFRPENLHRRVNETSASIPIDDEVRSRLFDLYARDVAVVAELYPQVDLSLWPNFAGLRV